MTDTDTDLRPRMTTEGRFCPTCGRRRTGYFRFCNECGFDFDELAPRPHETIAQAVQAQPVAQPAPSPIALSTVTVERPVVPPPTPRFRVDERSLVRVVAVGLGALIVLGFMTNLFGTSRDRPAATAVPSVALVSPVVIDSPSPSPSPSAEIATPSFRPTGPTQLAVVESIVDGDTITVDIDGETYELRYIGMDTPEVNAVDPTVKQFADAAAAVNASLVDGEEVLLERDVSETDQFGRLLRDVWIVDADGEMILVNLELVRRGYAQVATFPPDVKYVDLLTDAQEAARAEGLGMWGTGSSASPSGATNPAASSPPAASPPAASPPASIPSAPTSASQLASSPPAP